jgi:hypothetical protein
VSNLRSTARIDQVEAMFEEVAGIAITDYQYEPDRLVHEPARYRCRKCYSAPKEET